MTSTSIKLVLVVCLLYCGPTYCQVSQEATELNNVIASDSFLRKHEELILFYVFGYSKAGFVITKRGAKHDVYSLELRDGDLNRKAVPDSITRDIIAWVRMIPLHSLSLPRFGCENQSKVPHDFRILITVFKAARMVDQHQFYHGCLNSIRDNPYYPFYISLFALSSAIRGWEMGYTLSAREREQLRLQLRSR